MCLFLRLSERDREKYGIVLALLSGVLAILGIILIFLAIFVKVKIENHMILFHDYSTGTLPHFLISVGVLMFVLHGIGAVISFDSGRIETREKYQSMMVLYLVLIFVLSWVVLAGGALCFAHKSKIESALHNGFVASMKRYKLEPDLKEAIDTLQLQFRCCGSQSYEEWLDVSWVHDDYLDMENTEVKRRLVLGEYITDDVPFSCCSVSAARPCIRHSINDKGIHPSYSDVTLYKKGCTDALMDVFENSVLTPVGSVIIVVFFIEWLMIVLFRFLQTSIDSAYQEGDPEGEGLAYCCPKALCSCCDTGGAIDSIKKAREYNASGGGKYTEVNEREDGHREKRKQEKSKKKEKSPRKEKSKTKDKTMAHKDSKSPRNKKVKSPKKSKAGGKIKSNKRKK